MDGQGLGVPQIEQPLDELERIEECQSRVVAPLGPEGDDGRHAPVQVALDQVVVGMVGEAGEAHPGHPGVGGQVVGHGPGVGLVALEPHGHRLEALEKQECVEGGEGGAAVAQLGGAGPHGEGPFGEVAGEDDAVEGGLGVAALPDYMIQSNPRVVRILPEVEGNAYDVFFVYPEELRASKRIAVFRDFLLSKVAGWRF